MSWTTVVWAMGASACLTVSAIHLVIGLRRPAAANLLVFATGLAVAVLAAFELTLMKSPVPEEHAWLLRWAHVPIAAIVVCLVLFVWTHVWSGRRWLGWLAIGFRLSCLVLNFLVEPNFNFSRITGVRPVRFLGETASLTAGTPSRRGLLGLFASLLLIAFLLDATRAAWRQRARPTAIVGTSITIFIVIVTVLNVLTLSGVLPLPFLISLSYLGVVAAMGYELGFAVIRASQLELEVAKSRLELAHLSRVTLLGELSGSLAHEINQPLAAILANAQAGERILSRDGAHPGELRAILSDIIAADTRASEVIRRLRALLKKGEMELKPLGVAEIVRESLDLLRSDLLYRGVNVSADLPPGLPQAVGDRTQIQQVVVNLVTNACDAMEGNGGGERSLFVRAAAQDGGVLVSIADRGPGFSTEQFAHIFEPFFTTKTNGLGLGLVVCRTIVSAHRGGPSAR